MKYIIFLLFLVVVASVLAKSYEIAGFNFGAFLMSIYVYKKTK